MKKYGNIMIKTEPDYENPEHQKEILRGLDLYKCPVCSFIEWKVPIVEDDTMSTVLYLHFCSDSFVGKSTHYKIEAE